jgi:hypothetical protein
MAAMTTYTVRAKHWEHGWELHISDVGVTQSRTLDGADQTVRDYIESLTGRDTSADEVAIKPDLGGLEDKAAAVREWTLRVHAVANKLWKIAAYLRRRADGRRGD